MTGGFLAFLNQYCEKMHTLCDVPLPFVKRFGIVESLGYPEKGVLNPERHVTERKSLSDTVMYEEFKYVSSRYDPTKKARIRAEK